MQIPRMTVVLMVDQQRERGARCLQSILAQSNIEEIEILLYDNGAESNGPLAGSEHPSVRVLAFPPKKDYGNLTYDGMLKARAPIVALVEEHAVVYSGWAEALLKAHQLPYVAVSGDIYSPNAGEGISSVIYDYIYWATSAPRERGETVHWISQNTSFKRAILLQYGEELRDLLQSHYLLQQRLIGDGHKFYSEPDAVLSHANEFYMRSHWVGLFVSGRSFGATRARLEQWPFWKSAFYLLMIPIAPWKRLFSHYYQIATERPQVLAKNLRHVVYLFTFQLMGVLGQAVGLIGGEGGAGEQFMFFEMNEYRAIEGIKVKRIFYPFFGKKARVEK